MSPLVLSHVTIEFDTWVFHRFNRIYFGLVSSSHKLSAKLIVSLAIVRLEFRFYGSSTREFSSLNDWIQITAWSDLSLSLGYKAQTAVVVSRSYLASSRYVARVGPTRTLGTDRLGVMRIGLAKSLGAWNTGDIP